jgi:NitT/TauT family transport system substrate-binding protein
MLRESGFDIGPGKDVVFDVVSPADIPEIIEWDDKGAVGGFIVAEPFGSQVVKAGYGEEFALSKDVWPDHPCCVVVVQENLLEKYPNALHELTSAFVSSGQYIEANPDKAASIGADFLSQDQEVVKKVLTEPGDRVTYDRLYPSLEDLETMQNYLTDTIQAMSDKIDLEKFVDLSFAQAAGAK